MRRLLFNSAALAFIAGTAVDISRSSNAACIGQHNSAGIYEYSGVCSGFSSGSHYRINVNGGANQYRLNGTVNGTPLHGRLNGNTFNGFVGGRYVTCIGNYCY